MIEYGGHDLNIDILFKTSEKPWDGFYINNYNLNLIVPKEALNKMMEGFNLPGDFSHSEFIKLLVEEKDIYELAIKLLNINGKLNELSSYYGRWQTLESLLVPEDAYQKLIKDFDEAKEQKDLVRIYKTANKILSKLMIERLISSSCQIKKTILNKKENNMNQAEKPNSNAYRFEV